MFLKITVYTCLEITRVQIVEEEITCCGWKEFSVGITTFFGHPFEVVARIFLSTAKEKAVFVDGFFFHFTDGRWDSMAAFWFCYGLYIAPGPEGTRICFIGTHEEGPAVVRFQ